MCVFVKIGKTTKKWERAMGKQISHSLLAPIRQLAPSPGAAKVVPGEEGERPGPRWRLRTGDDLGRKRRHLHSCALRENRPIKYVCFLWLLNLSHGERYRIPGGWDSSLSPSSAGTPKTAPREGAQSSGSWVSMATRRRSGKGRGAMSGGKHNRPVAAVSVSHHFW